MDKRHVSRRDFIRNTAGAATAVAGVFAAPGASKAQLPSERLGIGLIGTGARTQAHLDVLFKLHAAGRPIELVAACDVYSQQLQKTADKIQAKFGRKVDTTGDYRELLAQRDVDLVLVATPDHWHARQTLDAMHAGKHVYCESPAAHTIAEVQQLVSAWQESGQVVQIGCQRTSDGRWRAAQELIAEGRIGKVVQAQTEYYRNSNMGQWRSVGLSREMTPANINWPMFLGTEFGLSPEMPFDRALFAQWRCYWPFSSGLFGQLFVHRLTELALAVGVRYPRRVTAGGGIFMEYDGRTVPDTATLIADYDEGLQLLVTASMCNNHPIEHCIRGHYGTLVFDLSREGFRFQPERPQVTRQRDQRAEQIAAYKPQDETFAHWDNFLTAIAAGDPALCHNTPELAAAVVTTVQLGVQSYREGRVLEWDPASRRVIESGSGFARTWEQLSASQADPRHVGGWRAEHLAGSTQRPPDFQKLAGAWVDPTRDPAG